MMPVRSNDAVRLSKLLDGITVVKGRDDVTVRGLCLDSRKVNQGDCFVALRGTSCHGAQYAHDAVGGGAVAVLVEDVDIALDSSTPVISVERLTMELGRIASRFFGEPSMFLDIIAVTGTNGKTTIAQLCAQACRRLYGDAGYAGTLGIGPIGELRHTGTTTPDPIALQEFFAGLRDRGCRSAAIEASSHAIVQSRIVGTKLDVVVFTNIGHDHLDYHDTIDAYIRAKKSLFKYEGIRHAVVNIDDSVGRALVAELPADVCCWTYAAQSGDSPRGGESRHLCLVHSSVDIAGSRLVIATPLGEVEVSTPLIGDFNAQNVIAALGALMATGVGAADAADALSHAGGVSGRMEIVNRGVLGDPAVIIDYAHTPESLAQALAALQPIAARNLICVFGCGGERDKSKRAPMGAAAEQGADTVIVTSDNPRGENNEEIAVQILEGMHSPREATVIHDRANAIDTAIDMAHVGDIVLIAGKGHESFQIIDGERRPFSDPEAAHRALRGLQR